jgi:hypothetical protein
VKDCAASCYANGTRTQPKMFREQTKCWDRALITCIACIAALLLFSLTLYAADKIKPYDLSLDEKRGGTTLAEHVGIADSALVARLQLQPSLEMTSSYFDRPTAERAVGAALAKSAVEFVKWMRLGSSRPNLTLHYSGSDRDLGHCLARGERNPQSCGDAVVILKATPTGFVVLTSYPDFDTPVKRPAR